jgi:hypothetical protein
MPTEDHINISSSINANDIPEQPTPTSSGTINGAGVGLELVIIRNSASLKQTPVEGRVELDKIQLSPLATTEW